MHRIVPSVFMKMLLIRRFSQYLPMKWHIYVVDYNNHVKEDKWLAYPL